MVLLRHLLRDGEMLQAIHPQFNFCFITNTDPRD
jgi:hypothetical protein